MKYFICSDIHGSQTACQKVVEFFNQFKCDKMLLLGDILYHGPRNDLPQGHNPKGVISLLNPMADKILACRGNCDAEVDQMVLNFPCQANYVLLVDNDVTIFCTHGHVYAPLLADGKIPAGCETASKRPLVQTQASAAVSADGATFPAGGENAPAGVQSSQSSSLILYGHTHVSLLQKTGPNLVICNPGSISLPKGGTEPGFAIYENHKISLFNIAGKEIQSLEF